MSNTIIMSCLLYFWNVLPIKHIATSEHCLMVPRAKNILNTLISSTFIHLPSDELRYEGYHKKEKIQKFLRKICRFDIKQLV